MGEIDKLLRAALGKPGSDGDIRGLLVQAARNNKAGS